MIEPTTISLLEEKIHVMPKEKGAVYLVGPIDMPIKLEEEIIPFKWYCWLTSDELIEDRTKIIERLSGADLAQKQQSSILVFGNFKESEKALIRMHSICHTGDIFGSQRCDCGYQLKQSMKMIVEHGSGALFYLANHEGRGIGLFSKAMAYILQENQYDTVEANVQLGFKDDSRNYEDALIVLKALREKTVTLITNNPKKLASMQEVGMLVDGRMALWGGQTEYNEKYLQTKINRSGHLK